MFATVLFSKLMNWLKRDHEQGICPVFNKEFSTPDSNDYIEWRNLICSECNEKIGCRCCELRKYLKNSDHKLGICPITNKQFTLPISKEEAKYFICDECGKLI